MSGLILVTGSEGMVGSRFAEITKFKKYLRTPKIVELDILDKKKIRNFLKVNNITAIINFAAYTDVNEAENQRGDKKGSCWIVNVEGVRNIAQAIKRYGKKIHFIQISTDMVFSGDSKDKGPYAESHKIEENLDRLTWYGHTKAQGEKIVKKILGKNATILRIIYPVRAKFAVKMDYLRKPLSLYDKGKLYPMFSDQIVSISFIDEVSEALDNIIEKRLYGTYHAASKDTATPFELVNYLIEKTRGVKNAVTSSNLNEFLRSTNSPKYRYPQFGGLKVDYSEKQIGVKFGNWKKTIDTLASQGIG